jgi:hypothetical protein
VKVTRPGVRVISRKSYTLAPLPAPSKQ